MQESYHFLAIMVVVLVLYWTSLILTKTNKLSLMWHKKIWNWVLSLSFVVSGSIGLVLAFLVDNQLSIDWYHSILWIHVEFGITMALVAIFHLVWHLRYYFPKQST